MSQDLKKLLGEVIEMHRAELCKMADLIYDFAEKSAEEYKSMELLTDYLQNEGFTVERGIALDTAFRHQADLPRARSSRNSQYVARNICRRRSNGDSSAKCNPRIIRTQALKR